MAIVTGAIRYDAQRTAQAQGTPGIAGVPVTLRNDATGETRTARTDAGGVFAFRDVPDGAYTLAQDAFPPISAVPNPPPGATHLDAVTPTTLRFPVAGADVTNLLILDGPVRYTPIQAILDPNVIVLPENLITDADGGTFGGFPPGTSANTGADPNPYPDLGTDFSYVLPNPVGITPAFHEYTLQNTMNDATANVQSTWWRVSDHTTGNETGRMMVINGDVPGSRLFRQRAAVKPNSYYLLSAWILNLSKNAALVDPQLGVEVLGENGQSLYRATLGELIPLSAEVPEWKQIGTLIASGENRALTVRFLSMGPEAFGNDYVLDDIALNEVDFTAYTPRKTVTPSRVKPGDAVTYTLTLRNGGKQPLTGVFVRDPEPAGLLFARGSVAVNGAANPTADPVKGFVVPDIPGGGTLTVTFLAVAESIPAVNPALNRANVAYSYTPVSGGIPERFTPWSNDAPVEIVKREPCCRKRLQ